MGELLLLLIIILFWVVGAVLLFRLLSTPGKQQPNLVKERLTRLDRLSRFSRKGGDGDSQGEQLVNAVLAQISQSRPHSWLETFPLTRYIDVLLRQSGDTTTSANRYSLMRLYIPAFIGLVGFAFSNLLLLLVVPLGYATLNYVQLLLKKNKRFKRFNLQLPDALAMMSSSLRAGHSLPVSLSFIAKEMPDPMGASFAHVVGDTNLGISLKTAFDTMLDTLGGVIELRLMVSAIVIQREVGGNLAEILDTLSDTIRQRFRIQGQIKALTGQSRLTGYVMGLAPLTMLIGLSVFFPGYMKPMTDTVIGKQMLLVALIMQVLGFLVIRNIVNIRV